MHASAPKFAFRFRFRLPVLIWPKTPKTPYDSAGNLLFRYWFLGSGLGANFRLSSKQHARPAAKLNMCKPNRLPITSQPYRLRVVEREGPAEISLLNANHPQPWGAKYNFRLAQHVQHWRRRKTLAGLGLVSCNCSQLHEGVGAGKAKTVHTVLFIPRPQKYRHRLRFFAMVCTSQMPKYTTVSTNKRRVESWFQRDR